MITKELVLTVARYMYLKTGAIINDLDEAGLIKDNIDPDGVKADIACAALDRIKAALK